MAAKLVPGSTVPMEIKPDRKDGRFTLERLQAEIGGYVEIVDQDAGSVMYGDEDGLVKRLPINETASHLAGRQIVGVVVVVSHREAMR